VISLGRSAVVVGIWAALIGGHTLKVCSDGLSEDWDYGFLTNVPVRGLEAIILGHTRQL
jgi:hypothetical protein